LCGQMAYAEGSALHRCAPELNATGIPIAILLKRLTKRMHQDPAESALFTVLCLGVGGSALALVGFWLETRLGGRYSRILAGVLFPVFAALAAVAWAVRQPLGVVAPFLALAAACLAAWATCSVAVRRWANRLVTPRAVWGLLLLACPIVSVVYAYRLSKPEVAAAFNVCPVIPVDERRLHAETDLGRKIDMFNFGETESLEAMEDLLLAEDRLAHAVIRLAGPNATYNCHGWVFAGGKFGVPSESVDLILTDNGYTVVQEPDEGDLVVYRDAAGGVQHTGLVRHVGDDGLILVESKWGPFGLYLHAPDTQPWGTNFAYYRSPRQGHLLMMSPALPESPPTPTRAQP
jgi:hypothetical protein